MRLAGIDTLAGANTFLSTYLPAHNARFAVAPADDEDAHQRYEESAIALSRICALPHTRKLSKDLVLSFNKQRYLVQTGGAPRYALRGATVTVVNYADGRIEILHGDELLPFRVFDRPKPDRPPVDSKTINARVDDIITHHCSEKSRPAPKHPWRHYPVAPSSWDGQLAIP